VRERTTLTNYSCISRYLERKYYPGRDVQELEERMCFYLVSDEATPRRIRGVAEDISIL